jgi:hypothetical protein
MTKFNRMSPIVTNPPPIQSTRLSIDWILSRGTKKKAGMAPANVRAASTQRHAFHVYLCLSECLQYGRMMDLRRISAEDTTENETECSSYWSTCRKARKRCRSSTPVEVVSNDPYSARCTIHEPLEYEIKQKTGLTSWRHPYRPVLE